MCVCVRVRETTVPDYLFWVCVWTEQGIGWTANRIIQRVALNISLLETLLEVISSLNKHIIACVEGYDRVTLIT